MSNQESTLLIKLKEIKEVSSKSNINEEISSNFLEDNVLLKIGIAIGGNAKEDAVSINLKLKFSLKLSSKEVEFFSFETQSIFLFKNFEPELLRIEEEEIFIEDNLADHLLNIVIGTTRGMMFYKTLSFPFSFILPLIDTEPLVQSMNKKNIKKPKK